MHSALKDRYRSSDVERRSARQRRTLLNILRHNVEWLKQLPNVHHVGLSTKFRAGRDTGRPSITIYVTTKRAEQGAAKIPPRLKSKVRSAVRSIQTDVCELPGVPRLFKMRGGAQIISSDMEIGTAGLVFSHRGKAYCITNAHVITDPGKTGAHSVVIPAPVGGAGTVVRRDDLPFDKDVESDAALILLNTQVDTWQFYNTNGLLRGFLDEPSIGQVCFYTAAPSSGVPPFTFQCQLIAQVHGSAQVEADGSVLTYRDFYRFKVLNGSPVDGHSGSLLYVETPNGLFGVGLAFGGIPDEELWAFPARRCFDRMMAFFDN